MTSPTVTPEQQTFARLYVRGVAPAVAYRDAFKPDASVKRKAIWKRAQALLARADVVAYIEALRAAKQPKAPTVGLSDLERLERMAPYRSPGSHAMTGARHTITTGGAQGSTLVDTITAALGSRK